MSGIRFDAEYEALRAQLQLHEAQVRSRPGGALTCRACGWYDSADGPWSKCLRCRGPVCHRCVARIGG